jgi:hypothetical protein
MSPTNEFGRSTMPQGGAAVSAQGDQAQMVNAILAQTDWGKYWSEVSVQVEREVEAYDSARARSMATAARRFIR